MLTTDAPGRIVAAASFALWLATYVPAALAQQASVVVAAQDQLVMDPTGAYMVVLNGPGVVDVALPGGRIAHYPAANLQDRGFVRLFADNQPLPVAVRVVGGMLQAWATPAPVASPGAGGYPGSSGGMTIQQQLQMSNDGAARTQQLMGTIGSWSR